MKQRILVLAGLLLVVPLAAQQPQPPQPPPEKCTVEGQVVKAGTGQPLKKARVVLRKEESRETPQAVGTDAGGKFQLKNVEPGRYRVYAVRNGYVRQEYGQRAPTRPGTVLTLAPGQQVRDIVFKLQPAAVIAGRVYDEDGEAVMGARVQALQFRYVQGRRQMFPARTATTNDRGEYRLIGLGPGRYFVSSSYSAQMTLMMSGVGFEMSGGQGAVDEGYAPVYYPNTSDGARATPLEVKSGNEITGIDLMLLPTRTARIRGRVFNAVTGKPGREAMLWLWPREEAARGFFMGNQSRIDDPQGNFELKGVTPGSYTLVAVWFEQGKSHGARLPLDVGGNDIDGVQLTIQAGVDVAGEIRVEGAEPAAAPETSAADSSPEKDKKPDWTEVRVALEREEWILFGGGDSARAKEDGSFVLENVSDDSYRITVTRMPPDYYLKAARMEGDDVLEEGLTVAGPPRSTLELVVSPNGGRIEGAVMKDGKPFSGATVTLVPEEKRRKRRELFKTAATDQYGRFTLRGISPGEYKLYAWEEIEQGAYEDAEFLKPYEKRGKDVRVDEASRTTVELTLIPAGDPR